MRNNKIIALVILLVGIQFQAQTVVGQRSTALQVSEFTANGFYGLQALGFDFLSSKTVQSTDKQALITDIITGPALTFDKEFIELGDVKKGDKKVLFYDLTNTGDEALEIELISACDCTTTTYPRTPIQPGETIRIDVVFDSSDKDESEEIDIDIFFTNIDPEVDAPLIRTVKYHFNLLK